MSEHSNSDQSFFRKREEQSSSEWRSWQQREGAHLSSTEQKWKTHSFSGGRKQNSRQVGRWRAQKFETREKCKLFCRDKRSGVARAQPSHQFQLLFRHSKVTVRVRPTIVTLRRMWSFQQFFFSSLTSTKSSTANSCIIFVPVPLSQGKHNVIMWSRVLAVGKGSAKKIYEWMSEANRERREWKWIFVLKRENIFKQKA